MLPVWPQTVFDLVGLGSKTQIVIIYYFINQYTHTMSSIGSTLTVVLVPEWTKQHLYLSLGKKEVLINYLRLNARNVHMECGTPLLVVHIVADCAY